MPTSGLIDQFTSLPTMRQVSVEAAQTVLALRFSVVCHRVNRDPMPELERRWGNVQAARRFRLVVEAIGHCWPEAFAVAPPCCARLSFDEALLAEMVSTVGHGDRAGFDRLTGEMLGGDARALVFGALESFDRARAFGRP